MPFERKIGAPKFAFESFKERCTANGNLSSEMQVVVSDVSPSIVCLVSYNGENWLSVCSGTIIDCKNVDGIFFSIILTSATLVRSSRHVAKVAADLKVDVCVIGGSIFVGDVLTYDFHYNLAFIGIKSEMELQQATMKDIDESLLETSSKFHNLHDMVDSWPFELSHCRGRKIGSSLFHGHMVVALGRHYKDPYRVMAAPGKFSNDYLDLNPCMLDCKELYSTSCKITQAGIGGPLVNAYGAVIGINFYSPSFTPFLPINIASRCFECFKKYGCIKHPSIGMEITDLYLVNLDKLEKIIQQFGNLPKAIFVKKVTSKSPADSAGIREDDVIVQCEENAVGLMEFTGKSWDKLEGSLEVVVFRPSTGVSFKTTILVEAVIPVTTNRWKVPAEGCWSRRQIRWWG